ncbi:hypothetical protein [Hyphomicrobium methylovorum]|uniref:hypothetical protein n=1 Tax=Hyphomicrobium methylovorum TaxID=84 RepID=UPI001FE5ED33|nr:hypothetical protein [Hyphomicrobium methylovorum]
MARLLGGTTVSGRIGLVVCGLMLGLGGVALNARPLMAQTDAPAAGDATQEGTETQAEPGPQDDGGAQNDAGAQDGAVKNEGSGPSAQADVKQIKLTDEQVKHFIAAQTDLAAITSKMQDAGDKPDPALQTELEGIAAKHGFGSFSELDDVAANISMVIAGLDANTGNFVDPVEVLLKEREGVEKDSSIPDADKKQLVEELTEAINTTPRLQYKENVEIVRAHRAEIEKALP